MTTAADVLAFWLATPSSDPAGLGAKVKRWYMGGEALDRAITEQFAATTERAVAGELDDWSATPRGRLALVIVLDQMTRSVFRGGPRAFSGDAKARDLVREALLAGEETELSFEERQFLLMPLVHSEAVADLERAGVELRRHVEASPAWARPILSAGIEQADKYLGVIRRFGRFPHRNAALGRESTPEEVAFLVDWAERQPPQELTKQLGKS